MPQKRIWLPIVALLALLTLVLGLGWVNNHKQVLPTTIPILAPINPTFGIQVMGNQLVDSFGNQVVLRGVNRSGAEYGCTRGNDKGQLVVIDGPIDSKSIQAVKNWKVNVVRIPLNEDCWLGINGTNPKVSYTNYQETIKSYVSLINLAGMYAILDLHWSAPENHLATAQQAMADQTYSPVFWKSVAHAFLNYPGVIFDLYNEPDIASWNSNTQDKWQCWLNGCTENFYSSSDSMIPLPTTSWQTAGMQELVDAVRQTGAQQPILLGGEERATDLVGLLGHTPNDPLHQLIADVHVYDNGSCNTLTCWKNILLVSHIFPIITGELGEYDCGHAFTDRYMKWADSHKISYLAWSWLPGTNSTTCHFVSGLITDWNGTPTTFGQGFKDHLDGLN